MESFKNTSTAAAIASGSISIGVVFYVNGQITGLKDEQERISSSIHNISEKINQLNISLPKQAEQLVLPITEIKSNSVQQSRVIKQLRNRVIKQEQYIKQHKLWFKNLEEVMNSNGTPIAFKKKRNKHVETSESESESESASELEIRPKKRHKHRKDKKRNRKRAHFEEDEDSELAELSD